jgi:protein gp37
MFLTKNSYSYAGFGWPANTMQGVTITQCFNRISTIDLPRPYLSIEPLLGPVNHPFPDNVEQVIVGAMTGPKKVIPKPEWIQSIRDNVPEEKIYWKKNIWGYMQ